MKPFFDLKFEEYLGKKDGVCVIEWCKAEDFHARVFDVKMEYYGEGRKITFSEPRNI